MAPKHILWTTLIVAGVVSITAGAVSRQLSLERDVRANIKPPEASQPIHPAAAPRRKEILGSEVVRLTRFGFEPVEITHHGRRFFLVIENRSGLRDLTLRLDREHGNRIVEVNQPDDQLNWVEEMNLPPGEYRISSPNQPGSVCKLTITP